MEEEDGRAKGERKMKSDLILMFTLLTGIALGFILGVIVGLLL